jgi:hypothetical protein
MMNKYGRVIILFFCFAMIGACCTKNIPKNDKTPDEDISLANIDIDKKYLAEGFISDDLYRVVIVTPGGSGQLDQEYIINKAKKRAVISLERSLTAAGITCDRNTRAEILVLLEEKGSLTKKNVDHKKYDVYYFDIVKPYMKNYLKNAGMRK